MRENAGLRPKRRRELTKSRPSATVTMKKETPVVGDSTRNLVLPDAPQSASNPPGYFFQRFGPGGENLNPAWPRITTETSESFFVPRKNGLRVLLINTPIREWSYPNIMPIGQGY